MHSSLNAQYAVSNFVMVHKHLHVVVPSHLIGKTVCRSRSSLRKAQQIMHLSQDNFFSAFVICLHSDTQETPIVKPFSAKFLSHVWIL